MKYFSLLFLVLAGLTLACCTKEDKVGIEEQASGCYWYNEGRNEVIYIDKENSAFIRQGVIHVFEENETSTVVLIYRNGKPTTMPYTIENNRFVFKEGYYIVNGITFAAVGYEEAWFDPVGNLIVQMGQYLPNGEKYNKDPRPECTWEKIYVRKDSSFLAEHE